MKKENIQNQQNSQGVLGFIFKNAKGNMHWFIFAMIASFVSIAATFLMPQVIRFTIDGIVGSENFAANSWQGVLLARLGGIEMLRENLLWCAVAVVVISVIAGTFNFFSRMFTATGTERFSRNLRNRLFRHVQYLPFKW